jgi:hypothetical protein
VIASAPYKLHSRKRKHGKTFAMEGGSTNHGGVEHSLPHAKGERRKKAEVV